MPELRDIFDSSPFGAKQENKSSNKKHKTSASYSQEEPDSAEW
jgi:hypothetical protein